MSLALTIQISRYVGQPSPAVLSLAAAALQARAYAETIRPIVESQQRQALQEYDYQRDAHWLACGIEAGRIVDPAGAYEMSAADLRRYYERCAELHRAYGFRFEQEQCPLLNAENDQRAAEVAFARACKDLDLDLDADELLLYPDLWPSFLQVLFQLVTPFLSTAR